MALCPCTSSRCIEKEQTKRSQSKPKDPSPCHAGLDSAVTVGSGFGTLLDEGFFLVGFRVSSFSP